MDKFGIFNILSGLLGGLPAVNGGKTPKGDGEKSVPETETAPLFGGDFLKRPVAELLSALASGNSGNFGKPSGENGKLNPADGYGRSGNARGVSQKTDKPLTQSLPAAPPLSRTLDTMRAHDGFVERVLKNNAKLSAADGFSPVDKKS